MITHNTAISSPTINCEYSELRFKCSCRNSSDFTSSCNIIHLPFNVIEYIPLVLVLLVASLSLFFLLGFGKSCINNATPCCFVNMSNFFVFRRVVIITISPNPSEPSSKYVNLINER